MTKKERMYEQIERHGANLNAIFNTGIDNIKLCKKLHSLEVKAHKLATDYCNGENGVDTDNWEEKSMEILKKVYKILNIKNPETIGNADNPIFLNGDARGYALKIGSGFCKDLTIYKDWGGYGILAPEFDGGK